MELEEIARLVGGALFVHDIQDVPKIDRLHHWQIGAALIALSFHKEIKGLLTNAVE
jgi:hypothetical protein